MKKSTVMEKLETGEKFKEKTCKTSNKYKLSC